MPSHVETPSRILGRAVGKTTFRSGLLSQDRDGLNPQFGSNNYLENLPDRRLRPSPLRMQRRLNQDMRGGNLVGGSATSSIFGLQARNQGAGSSSQSEANFSSNQDSVHKNTMSTVSRTFGLVSEDFNGVAIQNNEMLSSNLRRNDSVNSSLMPRTFGLQTRNLTLQSQFLSESSLRGNSEIMNCRRNNVSRTFGFGPDRVANGVSDNEGFIQDLRRNGNVSLSVAQRPFGHQLRNSAAHSTLLSEGGCRLNADLNYRSVLNPVARSEAAGSRMQESGKCGDETMENGGFRRPTLSRVIRGRNSLLSSRLFHNQNTDRHCRDLSNINGFNVSHISRRGGDTLSESRLALNVRSNWMDNQSIAGSMLSSASMKAQFMNLLENLHHSILNIGPHVTAEAVRMEFDKAKQGLENISEMSFAPSVREPDAASIISHSSKYISESVKAPAMNDVVTENVIDGGSFFLKSSEEVLKMLVSKKSRKSSSSTHVADPGRRNGELRSSSNSKDSDDEEVERFLFKKPKPFVRRKRTSRTTKAKASESEKKATAETTKKVINLKQWYPVALGSDLVLCGVDEKGAAVRTEPVKKRLNSRRVELLNGLACNLIGSPSGMVSVLPKKIAAFLRNGLTERWRVLQQELAVCQTAEEERSKRQSRSPKVVSSPRKAVAASHKGKAKKAQRMSLKVGSLARKAVKSKSSKVAASPKASGKRFLTRSGRTVKPPSSFWLVPGTEEVTSTLTSTTTETTSKRKSPKKKAKSRSESTPVKKAVVREETREGFSTPKKSPGRPRKEGNESSTPKKRSPGRPRKAEGEASHVKRRGKSPEAKSPKKVLNDSVGEARVHSSTEDAKRQTKTRQTRGKRKREVTAEAESVQPKKSKVEKKMEVEVESTVEDSKTVAKKKKQTKGRLLLSVFSPKPKVKKSPAKKSRKESKKKATKETAERRKEVQEVNEFEEDFELQLDDIEIPEIANVSGKPQLSRSQLRVVSMETPPLKYFNNNLRLLRSATPTQSPDWCISERTESEVKRFQKRREGALKKKARVEVSRTTVTGKTTKTVESRDLKRVMEWVSEKTVRSPVWGSKILQYVIPSRRRMEQQDDEEDEEDFETELSKPSFS